MAKLKITKGIIAIIFAVNALAAAGMLATGFSYLIDPLKLRLAAMAGMFFPFFAAANLLFFVFWLLVKPSRALLPFLTFAVCYVPVRMYFGITPAKDVPDGAMKVISYNVLNFKGMENHRLDWRDNPIVHYLVEADADIICLQESNRDGLAENMHALLEAKYPHHHFADQGKGGTSLSVYTKYPIVKVDTIPCDTSSVQSVAYTLALPKGFAMVVNNHFESNKFEPDKKKDFRSMMHGEMKRDSAEIASKYIFSQFTEMALRRNAQTKAVAEFLALNRDVPTILCGDFNDTPISFNYHRIARLLTDCFRATGFGFGWTYCHDGMRVRIDNIFCSEHFEPFSCKVLSDIDFSDHQPVVCRLDFKNDQSRAGEK